MNSQCCGIFPAQRYPFQMLMLWIDIIEKFVLYLEGVDTYHICNLTTLSSSCIVFNLKSTPIVLI
jgi:hypothetical protein